MWRTGCIINTRHSRCFERQISVFTMMCFGLHTVCTEFSGIGKIFFFADYFLLSLWFVNSINQLCCYFSGVFYMSFFSLTLSHRESIFPLSPFLPAWFCWTTNFYKWLTLSISMCLNLTVNLLSIRWFTSYS